MYKLFYKLNRNPFEINPDPEFFFESKYHMKALDELNDFLKENDPFIIVKGDYGVGKTHMKVFFSKVLVNFSDIIPIIINPIRTNSYKLFLRHVLKSLNIKNIENDDEDTLQLKLINIIENLNQKNKKIIFLVDDTQDILFSINLLRFLSDQALESFSAVQFILFAHSDFLKTLDSYPALQQRIRRIINIEPMDFDDTKEYIFFRLHKSGAEKFPYFPDESIQLIYEASGGKPRIINTVAYHCLLIGGKYDMRIIEPKIVKKVLELLELKEKKKSHQSKTPENESEQDNDSVIDEDSIKYEERIDSQENNSDNQQIKISNDKLSKNNIAYVLTISVVILAIGLTVYFIGMKFYKP